MRLELVTSVERLAELEPDWWDLWRAAGASPFQSPAWLLPWLQAFTREPVLSTIAVHEQGRLEALFPLMALSYRGERLAAPIGIGISDYLDVIVRAGADPAVDDLLSKGLSDVAREVERVKLEDVPHGSRLFGIAHRWGRSAEAHCVCPRLSLGASYAEYESRLASPLRQDLEQGRRELEALGVRFELADATTLERALDALFTLYDARPPGEPGVLADEAVRRFHRLAAPRLHSAGLLRLWLLMKGDRPLGAAELLLGDSACCYMTGYDPEFGSRKLSALLSARTIRDAHDLGKPSYDFLRGNDHYKYEFLAEGTFTYRLSLNAIGTQRSEVGALS
jgi:CelD/BcsL family acetyltransferase involved in cellulose biosynthesis